MWGIYPSLSRNVGVPVEQRLQAEAAALAAKEEAIAGASVNLLYDDDDDDDDTTKGEGKPKKKSKRANLRTTRRGPGGSELLRYANILCDFGFVEEYRKYIETKHTVDLLASYLQLMYAPVRSAAEVESGAKERLQRVLGEFSVDEVIDAFMALLRARPPRWMRDCCNGCLSKCLLRPGAIGVVWRQSLLCEMNEDVGNALIVRSAQHVAAVPSFIRPQRYYSCVCPQLLGFLQWGKSKAEERLFNAALLATTLLYRNDSALVEEHLLAPAIAPFAVYTGSRAIPPGRKRVLFDEQDMELAVIGVRHLLSDSFGAGDLFGPYVARVFRGIFDLHVFTARGISGVKELVALLARICLAKSGCVKKLVRDVLNADYDHPESRECKFEYGDKGGIQLVLTNTPPKVEDDEEDKKKSMIEVLDEPPRTTSDVLLSHEDLLMGNGTTTTITDLKFNTSDDEDSATTLRAELLLDLFIAAASADGEDNGDTSLVTSMFFELIRSLLLGSASGEGGAPSKLQLEFLSQLAQRIGDKCINADAVEFASLMQDALARVAETGDEALLTIVVAVLGSVLLVGSPSDAVIMPEQSFLFRDMIPSLERIRREFVVSPGLHDAVEALIRTLKDTNPSWIARDTRPKPLTSEVSGTSELGKIVAALQDPLPSTRGGALIRLRALVLRGEASVVEALPRVLDVLLGQLASDDNYVYESAISGLSCLGDLRPELVVPRLSSAYGSGLVSSTGQGEDNEGSEAKTLKKESMKKISAEVRVKVGEALLQTLLIQGEMLQAWEAPAIAAILRAAASDDDDGDGDGDVEGVVRASALSILASLVSSLPLSVVGKYVVEVADAGIAILRTDAAVNPRRAAALLLLHLERAFYAESPKMAFVTHKKEFGRLVDALTIASSMDSDEVVRGHCAVALEDLRELTIAPSSV